MKRILAIASALVLLAGCEKYDDTPIKEALGALENRVLALEKLNGEVAALKEIVAGSVTVASCVEADGVWTVTLSDGKSFKVQSGLTENPVVTVIEENGRSYWGYYQNGKEEFLLFGGKKIEVTSVVPAVKINEDNRLEISVDGGRTWTESDSALTGGLFSDVEQKEDCLVLTLSDGFTKFTVPFLSDMQQQFVSFCGKQYFKNGESKDIAVEMVGVKSFTVTERPEGWKTVLTQGKLTVTAPAKGVGDIEGYIKMIGVGSETSIASVYVTVGTAPCEITIAEDMKVTIKPNPQSFFYGASTLEDFDPESISKELSGVINPMLSRYPFASKTLTVPLSDMVEEVVLGETYVVWALPVTGNATVATDVLYQAVSSIGVTHEVTDVTFENANIYVNVKGTDTYYLIPLKDDMTLDTCIEDLNGTYAATYDMYKQTSSFMGKLTSLVESPLPGETYSLLVLPVKLGQLRKADAVTFTVTPNAYMRGGDLALSLTAGAVEYQSLTAKVTADNAYKCLVAVVSAAEYAANGYADDTVLLDYLSTLTGKVYSSAYDHVAKNLASGEKYYFLAVAIDRNGIMGAPQRLELSTKAVLPSSATITVSSVNANLNSATVYMSATGEIVKYRYLFLAGDGADYWYNTYVDNDQAVYDALVYGTCEYVDKTADEVASGIAFTDLVFGVNYIFRAVGYDSEGRITALAKTDITATVGVVVQKTDPRWTAMKPEVTALVSNNAMKLSVTFPQGCKSYAVTKMSSEEYSASCPTAARLKADYILKHSYLLTFTENIADYIPSDWYISSDMPYLLITWEDESQWYEPLVIDSATGQPVN